MGYQDAMVAIDHQEEMENRDLKEKLAHLVQLDQQVNKVRQAHRDLKAPLAQDSNIVGKNVFGRISMMGRIADS